jgi:alpha-D-xyloside xylohydrolase
MRAAFLEAPSDTQAWTLTDSYYFGEELYIAPIVTSSGRRSVYFPAGTGKYLEYFNKTTVHSAGTTCSVNLDMYSVPVYVKAGAIVPRGDIFQGNNKWTSNWQAELTVELYPSAEVPFSTFNYYSGASQSVVPITMSIDALSGAVSVSHGAVGVNGTFVLYAKGGSHNATLHADGGSVMFEGVVTLFD